MKLKPLLFAGLLAVALSGCSKRSEPLKEASPNEPKEVPKGPVRDAETIVSQDKTTLAGTWELRYQIGGMIARDPNHAPGNGTLLKFKENKIERYYEGKLTSTEYFTIADTVTRINQTSSTHFIKTGNNSHFNRFIRLGDGKLVEFIGQIAADGAEMTYVKIDGLEK